MNIFQTQDDLFDYRNTAALAELLTNEIGKEAIRNLSFDNLLIVSPQSNVEIDFLDFFTFERVVYNTTEDQSHSEIKLKIRINSFQEIYNFLPVGVNVSSFIQSMFHVANVLKKLFGTKMNLSLLPEQEHKIFSPALYAFLFDELSKSYECYLSPQRREIYLPKSNTEIMFQLGVSRKIISNQNRVFVGFNISDFEKGPQHFVKTLLENTEFTEALRKAELSGVFLPKQTPEFNKDEESYFGPALKRGLDIEAQLTRLLTKQEYLELRHSGMEVECHSMNPDEATERVEHYIYESNGTKMYVCLRTSTLFCRFKNSDEIEILRGEQAMSQLDFRQF